ncbi:CobW family GTP-binding protein [Marinifilum caeruleilacunae]|uniref:GTP-binding protein n=1 Tax=Marinifilum caeruleilacunae TaxID=2499076 RepID=A0ABX1WVH8_9BACT|nr:GTP-binding protein [Marinifilum caeruleilacunae]NOU59915.1 GTP-binding protein [Marinifilum caeruleilacunae]
MDSRIPVTIITGFLGAGKTTLLNQLIKDHPQKKFAIIENEFGEIGIDGGLIVGTDENIFELSNGCICCSLSEGFYETITKLLDSPHPFNHLLIETTGIADPDSIIKAFLSMEVIQMNFRLDSVICLADCANMEDLIDEQPEVRKQLALADVVLLNKADTIQENYLKKLQAVIIGINSTATIYPVEFANLSGVDLLDLKAFSARTIEKSSMSFQNLSIVGDAIDPQPSLLSKPIVHSTKHHHEHQHDIKSFGFKIPGSFDMMKFDIWMESFLYFNQDTVFRVKGILSFDNVPEKGIFQAVRSNYMIEAGEKWGTEARFSILIFIGKELNQKMLDENLCQLLAKPVEAIKSEAG